jgi:hypothetical protein
MRQELRLERLERIIKEQETSRLLGELLRSFDSRQPVEAPTTMRVRSQNLRGEIASQRTNIPERAGNAATHTRRLVDDTSVTNLQAPVTMTIHPPSGIELGDESRGGPDGLRGDWLIPNHPDNCVPDEFICQWTPCNVVFDTYNELVQHIEIHRLVFQCRWNECSELVPVTEALNHLRHGKHQAHLDRTCKWRNCLHKEPDRRKLNGHLSQCMRLQLSVFKCPWRDCQKDIKRYKHIKTHLLESHWKLQKRPKYRKDETTGG